MKYKIAENIKRLRMEHGMTQNELASLLSVTSQAVSRWESAQSSPDIEMIAALARYFSVSYDELLGGEEAMRERYRRQYLEMNQKEFLEPSEQNTMKTLDALEQLAQYDANYIGEYFYRLMKAEQKYCNIPDPRIADIVFIPANKYHFLQLTGTDVYERIVLNFYGSETIDTLLSCAFENRHFINVSADGKFAGLFERFEEYRDTLQAWQFEVVASSLLHEFLCLCCGNSLSQTKNIKSSEKILKGALNYINKNLTTIEDIQEIADAVFVSSSYIYQLFQKKLRISPKKLLAQKRLLLARSCILSGEPPYAVYQKCGYKDYSTFYRAYKSQFQQSPAESE